MTTPKKDRDPLRQRNAASPWPLSKQSTAGMSPALPPNPSVSTKWPRGIVLLCRHHRPHLTGRALLLGLSEKRRPHRDRRDVNNPFWWSADEKFFNNCLAIRNGIPVPNTCSAPSRELPPDTGDQSFSTSPVPAGLAWHLQLYRLPRLYETLRRWRLEECL